MPTLGHYLSEIYDCEYEDYDSHGNPRIRFKQDPELDASRTNFVLIYRGSFNPPHRGHMAILWHAYYQLTKTVNVVAAVIRPNPDSKVQSKCKKGGNRALKMEHRTRLWMENPHFPPWAWVKEDTHMTTRSLVEEINSRASKDGFTVQSMDLLGPDVAEGIDSIHYCGLTIVSNIRKIDDLRLREDGLPNLSLDQEKTWFGPWSRDQENTRESGQAWTTETIQKEHDDHERQQTIAAGQELAPSGLVGLIGPEPGSARLTIDEPLETQLARLAAPSPVYVCEKIKDTEFGKGTIYFLQSTPEQNAPFRGLSSTAIHKKNREHQGYKLKSSLETMALSPCLLWELLLPIGLKRERSDKGNHYACEMHVSPRWEMIRLSLCLMTISAPTGGPLAVDDIGLLASKRNTQAAGTVSRQRRRNSLASIRSEGTESRLKCLNGGEGCYICCYHKFVEQSRRRSGGTESRLKCLIGRDGCYACWYHDFVEQSR